jgi:hypothetical protein
MVEAVEAIRQSTPDVVLPWTSRRRTALVLRNSQRLVVSQGKKWAGLGVNQTISDLMKTAAYRTIIFLKPALRYGFMIAGGSLPRMLRQCFH